MNNFNGAPAAYTARGSLSGNVAGAKQIWSSLRLKN